MPNVNLRNPEEAGLLLLGVLLVVTTPLCVTIAALRAGMPLAALAVAVGVPVAGALVAFVVWRTPQRKDRP